MKRLGMLALGAALILGGGTASAQTSASQNLHHMANLPKSGPFEAEPALGRDMAFFGGRYVVSGNTEGFQITDIRNPVKPRVVSQTDCAGAPNDVSVHGNLLFTSTDSSRAFAECFHPITGARNFARAATAPSSLTWEGIRVFDISDPAAPRYLTAVETDCGSHTHTLLPDEANGRVLLYVSSYDPAANQPDCQPPHDKISVVEVPLGDPMAASVVAEPVLFPDGGFPGTPSTRATAGCADITVFPAKDLAAGACMGEGVILDISDKTNPKVLASITDPNFAFWGSATFSNDATKVIFTDTLGAGSGATCNAAIGPVRGADAIYDISDLSSPRFQSYFKISREQAGSENCVAHNGTVLPRTDRDVFVQAWFQGGVSVIDFTDGSAPREIAHFDPAPFDATRSVLAGAFAAYWFDGRIVANDMQRGLDVFELSDSAGAQMGPKAETVNPQTQY